MKSRKPTNLAIIERMKSSNNKVPEIQETDSLANIPFQELTNLLRDPVRIRVVTIVDIASLSSLAICICLLRSHDQNVGNSD